jgi:hypothetical protein
MSLQYRHKCERKIKGLPSSIDNSNCPFGDRAILIMFFLFSKGMVNDRLLRGLEQIKRSFGYFKEKSNEFAHFTKSNTETRFPTGLNTEFPSGVKSRFPCLKTVPHKL